MTRRPTSRKGLLRVLLVSGLLLGSLLVCRQGAAIRYTYGMKLKITQVRAGKEGNETVDPELSRPDVRALKSKYEKRYKNYQKVAEESQFIGVGKEATYSLANGKELVVTFESYRENWVNMKLRIDAEVQLMRASHGTRELLAVPLEGEDALILILKPNLVRATRK